MESKLNELNIFALRDLARRTGVSSPTSKKKEELIKGIIEIMQGKAEPSNKTKQGRPPKVFGYKFDDVFPENNQFNFNNITLNQNVEEFRDDNLTTVAGWLELVNNNNSAILWVNKNLQNESFFVGSEVLKECNAKTGDRAVVEVVVDNNRFVVKKIFSLNGIPVVKQKQRLDYYNINHISKLKAINFKSEKFANLNINKGENVYLYGSNNLINTSTALELLQASDIENKLYINVSITEKNKALFADVKAEFFVVNIEDDNDTAKRIVNLAIERAKRVLEEGKDVLVVVDDMLSISGVDKDLSLVKKLSSITKNAKAGSITLLSVMPNENIVQIEKLADKRFLISNNNLIEK